MTSFEILIGIGTGLLINEACDVSPWAARKLVRIAARLRYTDPVRAAVRAEELTSVIEERPGKLLKLAGALAFWAAACWVRARRGRMSTVPGPLHRALWMRAARHIGFAIATGLLMGSWRVGATAFVVTLAVSWRRRRRKSRRWPATVLARAATAAGPDHPA
ncbi:hypothetical protein [Microbispora sp. NPDC049125]|uniref:hypothetical protein n=1 Tax=Microbispora sp. NPDC049125 TaxID=3154929 RepID=UPI003466856D